MAASCVVAAQSYWRVVAYGAHKKDVPWARVFLQSCMAGLFVGMAGHTCTVFAGELSTDPSDPLAVSKALQSFCYASIFPMAFIAIIFTGAELFTGNTMAMLVSALERKVTALDVAINWTTSFLGNWLGTLFVAYFLSYLTGVFDVGLPRKYLHDVAVSKVSLGWGQCFVRAIGCNTYVCLALWFVLSCDDAAGKIVAMWFPIVAFALAGYQHIIANFYTLQVALLAGAPVSVGDVVINSFIPTLLGNMVAGCVVMGAVSWVNFSPITEAFLSMGRGAREEDERSIIKSNGRTTTAHAGSDALVVVADGKVVLSSQEKLPSAQTEMSSQPRGEEIRGILAAAHSAEIGNVMRKTGSMRRQTPPSPFLAVELEAGGRAAVADNGTAYLPLSGPAEDAT